MDSEEIQRRFLAKPEIAFLVEAVREIQVRIECIEILLKEINALPLEQESLALMLSECATLQFRKIIELIALATVATNLPDYKTKVSDLTTYKSAKEMFQIVQSINPDFYPQPIEGNITTSDISVQLGPTTRNVLTKERAISLYDFCNSHLHVHGPFKGSRKIDEVGDRYPKYLHQIKALLSHCIFVIPSETHFLVMNVPFNPKGDFTIALGTAIPPKGEEIDWFNH